MAKSSSPRSAPALNGVADRMGSLGQHGLDVIVEGLGYRISASYLVFRVDRMMVGLVMLGVLGALSDRLFLVAVERYVPWARSLNSLQSR